MVILFAFLEPFHRHADHTSYRLYINYHQLASAHVLGCQLATQVTGHATISLVHSNNFVVSRKSPESRPMLPDKLSVGTSGWSQTSLTPAWMQDFCMNFHSLGALTYWMSWRASRANSTSWTRITLAREGGSEGGREGQGGTEREGEKEATWDVTQDVTHNHMI